MLKSIQTASMSKLVLCFPGVGSAFAKKNAQTSLIIAKEGKTILVDCGTTIPTALAAAGVSPFDINYFHMTHSHADHVGGLEEVMLMHRYVAKKKPALIITPQYYDILWDKTLRGGAAHNEAGILKFGDLVDPISPHWVKSRPREMFHINVEGIDLVIFRTIHIPGGVDNWEEAFWSTGLLIDNKVLFTADTRFDPLLFEDMKFDPETMWCFHDCQLFSPGMVHASLEELQTLEPEVKKRIYLTHYGDTFDQFNVEDEFAGFAKPWNIYTF